jgi:ribosomal protein S16
VGRKKQPYWRVVVVPRGAPRDGAYIEELGFYNPRTRPAFLTLDLDKVDEWIQNGAEVTDTVKSLVRKARMGGDDDVVFTRPGEEAPRLKTAKKPERRPKSKAAAEVPDDMVTTDEAGQPEPAADETDDSGAEVTAAVETAEPADEAEATEAQAEAETESEAESSATEVDADAVEEEDDAAEDEAEEGEEEDEGEEAEEEDEGEEAEEADEDEETEDQDEAEDEDDEEDEEDEEDEAEEDEK